VLTPFGLAIGSLILQNALTPAQAALGELVTRRVDSRCSRRLMAAGMYLAPIALLECREVLDELSDARSGLVERTVTPGSAVAGLLALVARYVQLLSAVIVVGYVLGPVPAVLIGVTAFLARFGNRGSLSRWSTVIQGLRGQRRKLRYVMDSGSDVATAKEMRLLGILPWFTERAGGEARRYYAPLWRDRRRIYFAPFLVLTAVILIGATVVLIMLGDTAAHGALSVLGLSLAVQARLYEPTSGAIRVDGVDLREIDIRSWQQRLAVIFQDYVRYELDAAANISLGAMGRARDAAAIHAAASAAAAGFLHALPRGLATPLSSRYRGGVDLSGGQWQRVALARAMFAVGAGATVLILDEPTAQLDVRREVAFFDQFLHLTQGLTTVVISHRFSTVRRADNIVVLEDGRITEQGGHEELTRKGGSYARMFRLQARRFAGHEASGSTEAP
jgi:ABC-type cobalamin/Fe3+-siderophores transport system ATPase subunit